MRIRTLAIAGLIGLVGLPISALFWVGSHIVPHNDGVLTGVFFGLLSITPLLVSLAVGTWFFFASTPAVRLPVVLSVPLLAVGFGLSMPLPVFFAGALRGIDPIVSAVSTIGVLLVLKAIVDSATSWSQFRMLPSASALGLLAGAISIGPVAIGPGFRNLWLTVTLDNPVFWVVVGMIVGARVLRSPTVRRRLRVTTRVLAASSVLALAALVVAAQRAPTGRFELNAVSERESVTLGLTALVVGPMILCIGWALGRRERRRRSVRSGSSAYRDAPAGITRPAGEADLPEDTLLAYVHLEVTSVAILWLGLAPLAAAACCAAFR